MNQKVIAWCLAAVVCAGCQKGPQFNPRIPQATVGGAPYFPQPGSIAGPYFAPMTLSNQIPAEWLQPPKDLYRLGPGDTVELETLGEPLSRSTASIGPDGKVYYGLLPGTFVWGATLSEAKGALEQAFAKYLTVKPEVMVSLASVSSKRVWVLGQVRRPGIYPLGTPLTLLEAISAAGGTVLTPGNSQELADLENSFVMRGGRALPVNFYRLLRQGDLSQNIYLQADDFVYLRPGQSKEVSVLGAVLRPSLLEFTGQMTLLSALANAGGTLPYASVSQVVIVRGALSEPRVASVSYSQIRRGDATDVLLAPGDIVYVPFRATQKLEILVNSLVNEFVRTISINEGVRAVSSDAAPVSPSVSIGGVR